MVKATAMLERRCPRIPISILSGSLPAVVAESGCTICFDTGGYYSKPDSKYVPCPNGCQPPTSQHRGRVSDALVMRLRETARPTPILNAAAVRPRSSAGCLECGCSPAECGGDLCAHACCCIRNYPLPAVTAGGSR